MKKIFLLASLAIIVNLICAQSNQAVNLTWAKSIGGTGVDIGNSIVNDPFGNVFTVGGFEDIVDFDPGSSIFNLSSNGNYDVFIQKLDSSGNFEWAKSFGADGYDQALSIICDSLGNIYVVGSFEDVIDLNSNGLSYTLESNGYHDVFCMKIDNDGNFNWANSYGGIYDDYPMSLEIDSDGNLYTTGYFEFEADFNPGSDTYIIESHGDYDAFVQKLNNNGDFIWAKTFGELGDDKSISINLDKNGEIYISGFFKGNVDFDPSDETNIINSNGNEDAFIQKLSSEGDFLWAKSIGGPLHESAVSVTSDLSGNVYFSGYFEDTIEADSSGNPLYFESNGYQDIFIQKLDSSGNFLWLKTIGGIYTENCLSIITDQSENLYLLGNYADSVDFNPNSGINFYYSTGEKFLLKLDPEGDFLWVKSFGENSFYVQSSLDIDSYGNIFTTGCFTNSSDLDPCPQEFQLSSNGNRDVFVQKLKQTNCPLNPEIDTIIACNSYTWIDGQTYFNDNDDAEFSIEMAGNNCCDSLIKLDLSILNSGFFVDTQIACNSYLWMDGNEYASNNHSATYIIEDGSTNGCDSIIYLNLIIYSEPFIDEQVACNSFEWMDGNIYTASNDTSTFIIEGAANEGCDSIIVLDLTIYDLDIGVAAFSESLISLESNASYQWLNCDDNYSEISNATSQNFNAIENGSYAVKVSNGYCSDTSECFQISTLGINEINQRNFSIFPNPIIDEVNIGFLMNTIIDIKLYSITGQILFQKDNIQGPYYQFNLDFPKGIYLLEIIAFEEKLFYKLIKN